MCGIGFSYGNDSCLNKKFVQTISALQSHRGPDYSKILNFARFSLCHQRLSILDLSAKANQPFQYRNILLAFNGEIYNYRVLKDRLSSLGYSFETSSDTEVLAIGLHHFGESFLLELDGMFAIVYYDSFSNNVYFATDPFGIKSLYYYSENDYFCCSSEFQSIYTSLKATGCRLSRNTSVIPFFCSYLSLPPSQTSSLQIKRFEPGDLFVLNVNNSSLKVVSKFIPKNLTSKDNTPLHHSLPSAVLSAFISDVDQSILLSGGIDSSFLALNSTKLASREASNIHQSNLTAVTLDTGLSRDGFSDDMKYASVLSEYLSLPTYCVPKREVSINSLTALIAAVSVPGEISAAYSLFNILSTFDVDSPIVVHSGLGADEIFGGYQVMNNFTALSIFSSRYLSHLRSFLFTVGAPLLAYFPPSIRTLFSLCSSPLASPLDLSVTWDYELLPNTSSHLFHFNSYADIINFYFDTFLAGSHLPMTDGISMFFSRELRTPFLQRRVYSSVFPDLLYRASGKQYLKSVLGQHLGDNFVRRRKAGFGVSPINLSPSVVDYLVSETFSPFIEPFFDIKEAELRYRMNNALFVRAPYVLMSLLSLKKFWIS